MAVDVITSYSKYSWDSSDRTAGNLPGFGDNSDITPRLHDTGFERDAESGEEYYTYNGTAWVKRNIPAIKLSGSIVTDITFHDAAVAAAEGTVLIVGGYKTLTVEIIRTTGASTVAFMAEGPSGTDIPLMGVNLSTLATAISTTGTSELWQFDITGLTKVFMDLTAVATGPVTVKGKAVA